MITGFVGLGAAAGAAAEEAPDTSAPSAAPSSASAYTYSGDKTGVQWANGDTTAETEIGLSAAALIDPTSREAIVPPGETQYQTGVSTRCYWFVRHRKNGQYTSWVLAAHQNGCSDEGEGGVLL